MWAKHQKLAEAYRNLVLMWSLRKQNLQQEKCSLQLDMGELRITAQFHVLTTLRKNIEGNDMSSSEVFMSLLKTKQPDPGNGPIADFHGTTDLNSNGYEGLKRSTGYVTRSGYALKGLLYAGRSGEESQIGLASTNVGQLAQQFVNSNRNVYMDCYFTSYSTVKHLFEQDLTAIGTVFAHRRDVLASVYEHSKKVTMINYVPRKNSNVLLLTSCYVKLKVDN
ncbi:hypothetical protein T02_11142 [Trichinella nativa]|uniref:PiggyBac transposable element-derived protein domain-containing protein n=1 Tax=Trichinella nativa TaxID=6335 RepID=A0A0V1KKZ2_9BILA|nr:hypothetical protein T02_11142 [Trichinella nativa]